MSTFSKNLFDILGEQDDVRQSAPVKEQKKADEAKPAAAEKRAAGGNSKTNGAPRGGARRGNGRQQNGRPQRGRQFDRHSGTGIVDSEKKEKQGWGHPESAEAEAAKDTISSKDPAAGEENTAAEPVEAEEQVKTLDEYLAEKAAKSLKVTLPEARKANEGSETSEWNNAVAFVKEEEPEFFVSKDTKTVKKTEKQRKEKVVIEIEQRFQERTRGGFQGDRRGGAQRRGGRGNNNTGRRGPKSAAPAVNLQDVSAFPSLGATA
ncbi:hypothetical protein BX666DRAFT_1895743 [Dichotomocladium elegans]|nr:hypothetical protein BX666DRAFT_1895743 [Dichotomocladium elegans]